MGWITTTVTFSGGYTRGPYLAPTHVRHTVTSERYWTIQPYYNDGRGCSRYEPPLPGHRYPTKRKAEEAKRALLAAGWPDSAWRRTMAP